MNRPYPALIAFDKAHLQGKRIPLFDLDVNKCLELARATSITAKGDTGERCLRLGDGANGGGRAG